MNKILFFILSICLNSIICIGSSHDNPVETKPSSRRELFTALDYNLSFNQTVAMQFLESGLMAIDNNLSLLYSRPVNNMYIALPSELETWQDDVQLEQIEDDIVKLILWAMDVLRDEYARDEEKAAVTRCIYDFILFMVAHIHWNMCEIQYDDYRKKDGWFGDFNIDEINKYAIQRIDYTDGTVVSSYNKGKYSILNPKNELIAPLLKRVQYEELLRNQHLYNELQAYATWFYHIFGYTDVTVNILQNVVIKAGHEFEEYTKRFTLDHILRFNNDKQ